MTAQAWSGRALHFVGAGGAGMSGLALLARSLGADVSGCDRVASSYTGLLAERGIEVAIGHDVSHTGAGGEMVVSTAVPDELPELIAAREKGLPIVHRSELLASAAALRKTIAVSGTHGKTTTAAMIAHCMDSLGIAPGYAIGAELRCDGERDRPNADWGSGEWFVVEVDESDRSFLRFSPEVAVVTSLELDHHSTYASKAEFEAAFTQFAAQAGELVAWVDVVDQLGSSSKLRTFGIGTGADLCATNLAVEGLGTRFDLVEGGTTVANVCLPVPGEYNVLNALAALTACQASGADLAAAAAGLADFRAAGRRFEPVGERDGAVFYDDYAHHPTELRATLEAARSLAPQRLLAVFQPHLYSRTLHLHRELGRALALADEAVVLDVYPARERPVGRLAGVTGKLVVDAAADAAGGRPVWWLPTLDEAESMLERHLEPGTLVLTMGAGDVDELARRLVRGVAGGA